MSHPLVILLPLALFFVSTPAHAYLDPGTGGLIFQIGFAFFSLAMAWLLFPFRVIKEIWTRLKNRSKDGLK